MGNPAQMQTQAAAPAVVNLAAMKAEHRIGTDGELGLPPVGPAETCGVNPQVSPSVASARLSPRDCTTEQLFEIVIDVARRFRTAKEVVAEHKDYILRLKAEVFKVSFGSVGVRVPVACKGKEGCPTTRRLTWSEFCESQFGVSADWVNRVCGERAAPRERADAAERPERPVPVTDWKAVVVRLVHAMDQCGDALPNLAKDARDAAKEMLRGQPSQRHELAYGKAKATAKPQGRAATGNPNKPKCAVPTIAYPGGKARLAPVLASYMPSQGRSYLEPFAGLGNVFWAAASGQLCFQKWALNDIRAAPFLEAVRDFGGTVQVPERSAEEGQRQWEAFRDGDPRAILLEPYLTFNGSGYGSGWRGKNGPTAAGFARTLRACSKLLHATKAVITDSDWTELDWPSLTDDDFVFFDPPYLGADVRSYRENDINHEDLVRLLQSAKFKWMLTEYAHELYFRELGQPFFVQDVQLNSVNFQVAGGKERRLECAWKNY